MIIENKDLDNKELTVLPVRRGCSGGPCACSGYCQEIVGSIDRNLYEGFLRLYVSPDDWLKRNMGKPVVEYVNKQGVTGMINTIFIDWPNDNTQRYRVIMMLKHRLVENVTFLNTFTKNHSFKTGAPLFEFLVKNWAAFSEVLDECEVKYEVYNDR